MTKILLAGESWISEATHYKGFDSFSSTTFHRGADDFIAAAADHGITIEQMYAHDVPERFPRTAAELDEWDGIILSDIGANSFVLPPATWLFGEKQPNPLRALVDWTAQGGGLMMAGGYLSFQGFQARANFLRTPIAEVLPVTMHEGDDRIESPEGADVAVVNAEHPIGAAIAGSPPQLLGYNHVIAKDDADVVATVGGDVLIAAGRFGEGRSLVWTSDIGPHWCPDPFLKWDGFGPLVAAMCNWLVAG